MVMYDIKGGKHIKSIIDECINYQILHLDQDRAQVEAWLMENKTVLLDKYMK